MTDIIRIYIYMIYHHHYNKNDMQSMFIYAYMFMFILMMCHSFWLSVIMFYLLIVFISLLIAIRA